MKKKYLFINFLLFTLLFAEFAYAVPKVKVYVEATANDLVGSQLVYKIKEYLRSSQGMELALSDKDSLFQIYIVTLDPSGLGYQTVYSVVWTANQPGTSLKIYWNQLVGICGSKRVNDVAANIIARTDQMITELQKFFINLLKKLQHSYK